MFFFALLLFFLRRFPESNLTHFLLVLINVIPGFSLSVFPIPFSTILTPLSLSLSRRHTSTHHHNHHHHHHHHHHQQTHKIKLRTSPPPSFHSYPPTLQLKSQAPHPFATAIRLAIGNPTFTNKNAQGPVNINESIRSNIPP